MPKSKIIPSYAADIAFESYTRTAVQDLVDKTDQFRDVDAIVVNRVCASHHGPDALIMLQILSDGDATHAPGKGCNTTLTISEVTARGLIALLVGVLADRTHDDHALVIDDTPEALARAGIADYPRADLEDGFDDEDEEDFDEDRFLDELIADDVDLRH